MISSETKPFNLLLAGIGGQGVLLASEVLSDAAFLQGYDVKKSEVHGMSQRGGGVISHLRFGSKVFSPLIPTGQADILLALHQEEGLKYRYMLKPSGIAIDPKSTQADVAELGRSLNIYLLGALSKKVSIEEKCWQKALTHCLKPQFLKINLEAFEKGRRTVVLHTDQDH